MLDDVRYAYRMLLKSPGFTAVTLLTLSLGIGANTAIFSLIDAVLLKMLPVEAPGRLVVLKPSGPWYGGKSSYPLYERLRDQNHVFSGMFVSRGIRLDFASSGQTEAVLTGEIVSGSYFGVLGVKAVLGRTLTADDDRTAGGHPVAVISYTFWKQRFGLDAAIVAKTITLNGVDFTIIGVTPPEFYGESVGRRADVWLPMMMQSQVMAGRSYLNNSGISWLDVMARLKPDLAEQQARAELNLIFQQHLGEVAGEIKDDARRREFTNQRIELLPGSKGLAELRQQFSRPLLILMSVVGFVLLIACANVANLLLARAAGRQKEVAVRLALGADRSRLIWQLLTESTLLAVPGGVLGLLFAYRLGDYLVRFIPWQEGVPFSLDVSPDTHILVFTGAISLFAAVLFGLTPALQATRVELVPALKENLRTLGGSRVRFGMGRALVVVQLAVSSMLLVGAGLMVRSLQKFRSLDVGFTRDNVLLVNFDPEASGYSGARLVNLYQQLTERVSSLPGVRSASLSTNGLFGDVWHTCCLWREGKATGHSEDRSSLADLVTPGFFETLEMPLLLGRDFVSQDGERSPRVAVVNETLARSLFHDENPIGKQLAWGDPQNYKRIEIVGVVKDAKYNSLREQTSPFLYLPYLQNQDIGPLNTIVVRTSANLLTISTSLRHELRTVARSLPITGIKPLSQKMDETLAQEHMIATLSSWFGLLALALAAVGVYGVMAHSVALRTHEIGIRIALGAKHQDVFRLVLGQGLVLTAIGLLSGLGGAVVLTRVVSGFLYGVTPTDPATFAAVSLGLLAVAFLACYLPARRAMKVDPMVALR